jgi:hypothetical protein
MDPTDGRDDVIENGDRGNRPAWWPGWAGQRTIAVAAAALAVGLIAGYLGGHWQGRTPQPPRPAGATSPLSSPWSTAQNTAPALGATGNLCAVQRGTTLQLGVEVANQSDQALAVGDFRAVLPIGGLRATAAAVGTCGALSTGAPTSFTLPAGATEWLTVTLHVLVRCPQPYPVQFVVSYTTAGKMSTAQLDEFPDLGQVAYSGCPSGSQLAIARPGSGPSRR